MSQSQPSMALFAREELQHLHETSLQILEDPGMRIQSRRLRGALGQAGAEVDEPHQVVRFPARLVEDTLAGMRSQVLGGTPQLVLNGVVASRSPRGMGVKFGGACIEVLDLQVQGVRAPTRSDLARLVQLGEALPEVVTVGNPVMYLREDDGCSVDPRLQRVKTAALIAQFTTKAGSTEVWNAAELKYLMELGEIVRGSREAYLANPCFITAKETIAPLILDEAAGDVLLLLAENHLPCTIIPMPITGGSSPLTLASNIALGNAEILGTFCALRAACPSANCVGGIISGVLDMRFGAAVFGAPEAVLQDIGLAQIQETLYGFDFGIGGYTDAKLPGEQIAIEAMGRFLFLAQTGRFNVPVGLLNGGKRFSAEQALVEIEIERWIVESGKGIEVTADTLCLEQIRRVGIGGHSMQEEHTIQNMRKNIWYPQLMDRSLGGEIDRDRASDMLETAARKVREVSSRANLYEADTTQKRAIEQILRAAEQELTAGAE